MHSYNGSLGHDGNAALQGGGTGPALVSDHPGFKTKGSLEIRSTAFEPEGPIPRRYSKEDQNLSPPLVWSGVPAGTKELVLVCEDPDAPRADPFVHWIIYGIPPQADFLPGGIRPLSGPVELNGASQGMNSRYERGYMGPLPPPGHGTHRYHFQLFALDKKLGLPDEDVDRADLVKVMEGHVIASAIVIGTYVRKQ